MRHAADHLAALSDPDWAVWRWLRLRGAGFPVTDLAAVASPACTDAADDALACADLLEQATGWAVAAVSAAATAETDGPRRRRLGRLHRQLNRREPGRCELDLPDPVRSVLAAQQVQHQLRERAEQDYRTSHAQAVAGEAGALRERLRSPALREALLWQSPAALHRVEQRLTRLSVGEPGWAPDKRERADLQLVQSYLQRYCAKNDTIGFFGPVSWARLDSWEPALVAEPGPDLLSRRTVRWESWGIEALAARLAGEPALAGQLVAWRLPLVTLHPTGAQLALGPPQQLTAADLALLSRCDGSRTVAQLAAELGDADVPAALRRFAGAGLIQLGLPIPLVLDPQRALADQLAAVPDRAAREAAQYRFDLLEQHRVAVADAAGDPERLRAALSGLDTAFTELTSEAASRGHGAFYAARSLVYEECTRDLDLRLGESLLADLAPALSLLLTSGRWLSGQVSRVADLVLRRSYQRLSAVHGDRVPLAELWLHSQAMLFEPGRRLIEPVLADFQQRWGRILGDLEPARRERVIELSYTAEQLAPAVAEQFGRWVPAPRAARYHSPDLLLAAASPQAVRRGEYVAVLGELHLARNTLLSAHSVGEHPDPEQLHQAWRADLGSDYTRTAAARDWGYTVRTAAGLHHPDDWELLIGRDSVPVRPDRARRLGDLFVRAVDGDLIAEDATGAYRQPLRETLGEAVAPLMTDLFTLLPPADYQPRLRIDRLVVSRRSWRLPAAERTFAARATPAQRYLGLRSLAARHGLPRRVFLRSPAEPKPVYADLASTTSGDLLCKLLRGHPGEIVLAEMLPDPDGMWLPDAAGNRYSSELRLAAVDLSAGQPPNYREET